MTKIGSSKKTTLLKAAFFAAFLTIVLAIGCGSAPFKEVKTTDGLLSYSGTIAPVLDDKCHKCHGLAKFNDFSIKTYESLMKGGELGAPIIPGDPQNSRLVQAIEKRGDLKMPPKPYGPMEPNKIEAIKTWIKEGALNN